MNDLPGRGTRVLIWGFGRHGGGLAAARFCARRGATVSILDRSPAAELGPAAATALGHGWRWHVGDGAHAALQQADLIVASPAIAPRAWPAVHPPRTSPEGLFVLAHRGRRLAVTGTKGKSTTARIAGDLLRWEVAGNSYEPLLDVLERVGAEAPFVCELSSFQMWYLASAPPRFEAAILTSLASDHLDWHPDLAHYHAAKLALLGWAGAVAADPAAGPQLPPGLPLLPAVTVTDGVFRDADGELATSTDLHLLGSHNQRNAALAIAAALALGTSRTVIADRLRSVRPLPHRLEPVGMAGGLQWYNDSIATTPEAAMAGLAALAGPLAIILGGSDKGADFTALAAAVATRAAIPLLIGSTAGRLHSALAAVGVEAESCGDLPTAMLRARHRLAAGGTVLLSPACASFDQFRGFEHRGDCFRALVPPS